MPGRGIRVGMAFWRKQPKQDLQRRTPRVTPRTAEVFSYYASHDRVQAPSDVVRRPVGTIEDGGRVRSGSKLLVQLPTWLALAAIVFSLVFATLLSTNPRIQIDSQSALVRPVEQYQAAARKILQDSVLSKSKLTIDTNAVAAQLQVEFPELQTVTVAIPLVNQRPILSFAVAEPVFLLTSRQGGSYFIDNRGKALVSLDEVSATAKEGVLSITDEGGLPLEAGKSVLTQNTVDFITTVTTEIKNAKYSIESAVLAAAPNELQLRLIGKPYYIRLNTSEQGRLQAGTLLSLLKSLEEKGITPAEYIDLRVSEKAFYK